MKLFMIDAIGPFFRGYQKKRINWSKIPFHALRTSGEGCDQQWAQIRADMEQFADRVSAIGYNAVTLDDVAHLVTHRYYEDAINERIEVFRREYRLLFDILQQRGLQVYLTMDVLSATSGSRARIGYSETAVNAFITEVCESALTDFSAVAGIIVRIGESDGQDVVDDFRSELHIKTAAQLNRLVHALLPVFEKHQRKLVLRTWTVGAYPVGDLIWHRNTLSKAIANIDSDCFVLSMKHGESDFFRYLPLNRSFFRTPVQKIVELQSKREYEGAGEFPAFIGGEYEQFARELRHCDNMLGISVWCQTGGWLPFRRLAFVGEGSPWTEINTEVSLRLFRDMVSVERALHDSSFAGGSAGYATNLLELMRLSEQVIGELYYIEEFSRQKLFFRRVRIPPLIGVYWNTIFINHSLRKLLRFYIRDPEACIRAGSAALEKINDMRVLARDLGLPEHDIIYMKHTLRMLAVARRYYFEPFDPLLCAKLQRLRKKYKKRYPKGSRYRYAVRMNFEPFRIRRRFMNWALAILLRKQRGYRLVDQIFTMHLLGYAYRLIRARRTELIPAFARKSAMGIDAVMK